jgi:hypothetical protein
LAKAGVGVAIVVGLVLMKILCSKMTVYPSQDGLVKGRFLFKIHQVTNT